MKRLKNSLLVILMFVNATIFDTTAQSTTDKLVGGFNSILDKAQEAATDKYKTVKKYIKEKVSDVDAEKVLTDIMANNGIVEDDDDKVASKIKANTKKKAVKKHKTDKENKIDLDDIRFEKKNKAYEIKYKKDDAINTTDLAYRMMVDRKNATVADTDENVVLVSHKNEAGEEDCTWKLRKINEGLWKFKITKAADISIMEKYFKEKIIARIVEESFITAKNNKK